MTPQQHFKPFQEAKNWLRVHRSLIKIVMLQLTGSEWKIFCFIMEQTLWEQSRDSEYEAGLSYKDISKGSGVKSPSTLASALKRLRDLKYIIAREGAGDWDSFRYSLNLDMEIDLESDPTTKIEAEEPTPKIKAGRRARPTPKIEVESTSESEGLKRYENHGNKKRNGASAASAAAQESLDLGLGQGGSMGADPSSGRNVQVPTHKELLAAYELALTYKIPNYKREGTGAKQLIDAGYTLSDVIGCYHFLKGQEFYAAQHVSLQTVCNQIGAWVAAGRPADKASAAPRRQAASEQPAAQQSAPRPATRLSADETRDIFGGDSYGVRAMMAKQGETSK